MTVAVARARRPSVIWLHFQDCTGCSETLLRTSTPDLADLILNLNALDCHETLLAAAGRDAEAGKRGFAPNASAGHVLKGDTSVYHAPTFPKGAVEGCGFHEALRGTLSHWVVVKDGALANYQAVVPTTWNASPRDEQDTPGPYEAAVLTNPIADPAKPLEVLRTVHSFDPCMACACHVIDVGRRTLARVKVL